MGARKAAVGAGMGEEDELGVKVLATKANDLSSIPRSQKVAEGNRFTQAVC